MPALHNGLTSNPKLQEAYRRALGEQSQSFSGLERGSESLQPIMDLWALPEWALLRGERLFSLQVSAPAVAARNSSVELVNPAGSGILAVVLEQRATFSTGRIETDTGAAIAANPVTANGRPHDARLIQAGTVVSQCRVVTGDVAAGVANPMEELAATASTTRPWVIQPGRKLFIIHPTQNTALGWSIFWSERNLLSNEQNP